MKRLKFGSLFISLSLIKTFRDKFIVVLFSLCLINATASAGWQTQPVDSAGVVGGYTSLAFDLSGNPAISYDAYPASDWINGDLKYAHDANGDGDFADPNEIIAVDVSWGGEFTSLAFDLSGNPAISYFDGTNLDLKYAHDANGDGDFTDPGEIIPVDSAGDVGWDTSLTFDSSGNPAISYFDGTNLDLKYAHDANGDGDFTDPGEIIPVDSAGAVGRYTSLAFDSLGNPAISYYDETNGDLKYAHDANGDGDFADAGEIIPVDSAGAVGRYTSLAFDSSGYPTVSYYDETNVDLKYAHFNGASWDITTVDSIDNVGWFTSLAFDLFGNPAISYYDLTNADLKYARFVPDCWCPADSFTACVSGQVKNSEGEPLVGKTVKFKGRLFPGGPSFTMKTRTDDNGCYKFTLPEGIGKIWVIGCRDGGKKDVSVPFGSKVNGVDFECKKRRR